MPTSSTSSSISNTLLIAASVQFKAIIIANRSGPAVRFTRFYTLPNVLLYRIFTRFYVVPTPLYMGAADNAGAIARTTTETVAMTVCPSAISHPSYPTKGELHDY